MTILNNILAVSWHEFRVMCTRYSILLVLSGGIFVYGLLYNYMYAPNVVRNAPVAVVDMSRTPLSRSYIRLLDATPQARVLTNNADLPAAKELMKCDEVVGIVYIPSDFDARVGVVKKRYILCTAPLRLSFILLPCRKRLLEPCLL